MDSIEESVEQYAGVQIALKALYDERERLLADIWSYMDGNNQKLLDTRKFTVRIPTKRAYDISKFQAVMGELLSPDQMNAAFIPEHEETKVVKAKVDGRKVLPLWNMGDEVVEALNSVLIPQAPEIKVEAKKKEQAL